MGVYIKDLKKPKDCYECPIAKSYLDCLMEKKYVCPIGRTDDCPLIDIVQCKYCIHHDDGICRRPKWAMGVEPTDFCSYGEPRRSE